MAVMPFEHADEVRAALRAIVADPAHGAAALSSSRVMPSLLSDLLPDAPREAGLLAAAAQRDVAGMLAEHVAQGLDIGVAVSLVASSFAGSTAFTPQACPWGDGGTGDRAGSRRTWPGPRRGRRQGGGHGRAREGRGRCGRRGRGSLCLGVRPWCRQRREIIDQL